MFRDKPGRALSVFRSKGRWSGVDDGGFISGRVDIHRPPVRSPADRRFPRPRLFGHPALRANPRGSKQTALLHIFPPTAFPRPGNIIRSHGTEAARLHGPSKRSQSTVEQNDCSYRNLLLPDEKKMDLLLTMQKHRLCVNTYFLIFSRSVFYD